MGTANQSVLKRFLLAFTPVRLLLDRLNRADIRLAEMDARLTAVDHWRQGMGNWQQEIGNWHQEMEARLTAIDHWQREIKEQVKLIPDRYPVPQIINMPNPQLRPHALRILSLLRPQGIDGKSLVRKGRDFDGGYLMLDHGLANTIVYSLGISDDVSWDLDMAKLGCEIYQYDHTIDRLPLDHPKFHWSKIGIGEQDNNDGTFRTIGQLIDANGHQDQREMILKMDIEGAEWKVFETLPETTLEQFSQIVIELHWLIHIDDPNHLRRFVSGLEKLNRVHQIIHVHANNFGSVALIGGVLLPDSLEVTYVRKSDHVFSECRKTFPTELDMPCDPNAPEFFLGAMGQI